MRINVGFSDFYIGGGVYATTVEVQIGRVWAGLVFPRYWLYSSNRARFLDEPDNRTWAKKFSASGGRSWFFAWPGFIRLTRKDD